MYRVYVAGKYSDDDVIKVLRNMRDGIGVAVELIKLGYAPFTCWLDFQLGLVAEIPIEIFKAYSMEWLRVSDAVLLVHNWRRSQGAIEEVLEAKRLKIPVFESIKDLDEYFKEQQRCVC